MIEGITVPDNARIIRNLLMGAQFLHDHIVHFFQLHALDWVDITSAIEADPAHTADLARAISLDAKPIDFASVLTRLRTFVGSGKLGPFAEGYWGHPAYLLAPEENLLLTAHYLETLRQQARTARMHALFGAKNPHPQSLRVGGVTCKDDLNMSRFSQFRDLLRETKDFIDTVYLPDVILLAEKYRSWSRLGRSKNFLAYGEFPQAQVEPESLFFPRGAIFGGGSVTPVDQKLILEHVKHSWYQGDAALHPATGVTQPAYTSLNTDDRYSWLKAPRYREEPVEVGPLARILVAQQSGQPEVVAAVSAFLSKTGLAISDLNSTLGRTIARALETQIIAKAMEGWLAELEDNVAKGNRSIFQPWVMPAKGAGFGLNEAPRGALGHWIDIQDQKIANYQMVVPSTWNFGPRCTQNKPGPVEQALVGTPVADIERPVEILRTIHSFDPCIACAVHVIDRRRDRVCRFTSP